MCSHFFVSLELIPINTFQNALVSLRLMIRKMASCLFIRKLSLTTIKIAYKRGIFEDTF